MQTQKITLDFCQNEYKTVTVKRGDKDSRHLIVTCTDNGIAYALNSSTQECNVKMHTPDNRAIYNATTINNDGTISITFTESMLYKSGTGTLEIQIVEHNSKKVISTMLLTVIIVDTVYSDDTIIASDEYSALTSKIFKINQLIEEADETVYALNALEETVSTAESYRVSAENDRISAENKRISAENTRNQAEVIRNENEIERQENTTNAINNANTATERANTAASEAESAADKANAAADIAKESVFDDRVTQLENMVLTLLPKAAFSYDESTETLTLTI